MSPSFPVFGFELLVGCLGLTLLLFFLCFFVFGQLLFELILTSDLSALLGVFFRPVDKVGEGLHPGPVPVTGLELTNARALILTL